MRPATRLGSGAADQAFCMGSHRAGREIIAGPSGAGLPSYADGRHLGTLATRALFSTASRLAHAAAMTRATHHGASSIRW